MADWNVVGLSADPAPGDVAALRALAHHLGMKAETMARLVTRLQRVVGGAGGLGMIGDYAAGYRTMLAGLPPELSRADRAFRRCGEAVTTYADLVDDAQALAQRALSKGVEGTANWRSATSRIRTVLPPTHSIALTPAGVSVTAVEHGTVGLDESIRSQVRNAAQQARTAWSTKDAGRKLAQMAADLHTSAQRRVVREIGSATEGVRNEPFWRKVFHTIAGAARLVDRIVRRCLLLAAVVLSVLAIVMVVVLLAPTLALLATWLAAYAAISLTIATVLSAVLHLPLATTLPAVAAPWLSLLPLSRWIAPLGRAEDLDPPPRMTPDQANDWWRMLTPAQQQQLVREHPELIGPQDGLPVWARDTANRGLLAREKAKAYAELEDALGDLAHDPSLGVLSNRDARVEVLQARLQSIEAIEQTLALDSDDPSLARSLLELDCSKERVEAAIGIGPVETAEHVAVFVPGLTSTVNGSLASYDQDMKNLLTQANGQLKTHTAGGSTAGVVWIGYQAPQLTPSDVLVSPTSVTQDAAARAGGDQLARFTHWLTLSRDTDPHLSVVAHSYGSTTAGFAAQHQGTDIDGLVLFGSPGPGVTDAADLNVGSGSVYAIESSDDVVADLGQFGGDPSWMPGVTHLSADAADSPAGADLSASHGHSEYLRDTSTSQYNLAVVISGHPEDAVFGNDFGTLGVLTAPVAP